ncbi:MAG: acyltransferase family protein [Oscillospiraceae bacterium]|nr:acyltransferase family protein [Oscillospiraceae bacterium]
MKKRLLWIDMLKITSMLMILILHIFLNGGILYRLEIGSAEYAAGWFIESVCYCAVNCYAIITGYLMYRPEKEKFNYSRIIPLWLQVFFYSAAITVVFLLTDPECFAESDYSAASGFMPVLSNTYWYFTSYFGMFFFIPFMNVMIRNIDKKEFTVLVGTAFAVLSFIPFTFTYRKDPFGTQFGYSTVWLAVLYLAGAYIKRFGDDFTLKKRTWAAVLVFSSLIPCVSSLALDYTSAKDFENVYSTDLGGLTYNYTSPFTVISAVSLFMLFKDAEIRSRLAEKLINFFAPASFSVYLIHTHPLVFEFIFKDKFVFLAGYNAAVMLLGGIFCAVFLYAVLSAADHIRMALFKALKVSRNSERLVNSLTDRLKSMKVR